MRKTLLFATLLACMSTPAWAQDAGYDDPPASRSTSRSGARFGVGMFATLTPFTQTGSPFPLGGAAAVFDTGSLRFAGRLNMFVNDSGDDGIGAGVRLLVPVHEMKSSDFSLGGGIGFGHVFDPDPGDDTTFVLVEGIGQIRVFLVENVALHGDLGVAFAAGESVLLFGLGAQFIGGFGLTYFF